jgi:chromosome segregation ATPase
LKKDWNNVETTVDTVVVRLEDVEDDMQVCKTDVDVAKIQLLSLEKDVKDMEMSVDNAHLQLEKVEDQVDGFIESVQRQSSVCQASVRSLGPEIQRIQKESHVDHESLPGKFTRTNDVIDKKFVQLDTELEKVVDLAGMKIKTKVSAIATNFAKAMEIEKARWSASEAKIVALEEKPEHALSHIANLAGLLISIQNMVGQLEDVVMEEGMMQCCHCLPSSTQWRIW